MLGWLILLSLLLWGFTPLVFAEDAIQSKEYFTQQPADTPVVIRLDAFETEFESRIFDPKNILLRASGVPAQRLAVLYQLIEAVDRPRQLRIEVAMGRSTSRSRFNMQVIRFEPGGPDKSALIQAYRLLSFGLELESSRRIDAWTMKVIALKQAANIFDELGMQELQLWSEFHAHHYLLLVLNDPMTAAEGAGEIHAAASRSSLNDLALAALQLEGSALVAQTTGKDERSAADLFAKAQALFQQAADLAVRLDFRHERARAIYHSGLAYQDAGNNSEAFAQFDLAVGVATDNGDTALANQIRQHAAELHESLGDNAEAIALMQQISVETPVENPAAETEAEGGDAKEGDGRAEREMVTYLFEQGRLLEKTYRHTEAAEVLRQALELNQKSPAPALSGPVALLLAKALYGAGQMDAALQHLQDAIKKTPAFRHEQELAEAYGVLAAIQRGRGDFAAMSAARARQDMFVTEPRARAAYTFESALDDLAANGAGSPDARALLRQSEKQASESGARTIQELASLQLCALGKPTSGADTPCTGERAQNALAFVQSTGLPGPTQQARLWWSQILHRDGHLTRAIAELDRLIEDMRFFQSYLPGVLGAWYWQNHEAVFSAYMEWTLEQTGPVSAGAGPKIIDTSSLAALDRLTRLAGDQTKAAGMTPDDAADEAELKRLRSLIAARETAASAAEEAALAGEILPLLRHSRQMMGDSGAASDDLTRQIERLADDEALLTYYFAANRVYAWVGRNDRLQLVQIPWSANQAEELTRNVEGLRRGAANGGEVDLSATMDRWGQTLLAPVAKLLPQTIYFVPSGLMEGFPLDALRWNGHFLAARHQVINLLSLDALGARDAAVGNDALQRFFLAGNRQEGAGDFAQLQPPSAELGAITELFVGPGLHIVQGAALQWEEFQDERFTGAGVVHLAMPGIIDLRNPQQSRLLMSDNTENPEHEFLLPNDIRPDSLSADLVVLSACEFTGTSQSAFDHTTPFIAQFLQAARGAVLASLWQVGDLQAAQFMQRFYHQLMTHPDAGEALSATKRSYLAGNETSGHGTWAAFQLFAQKMKGSE
jgi:CHAT domain-containing protein/tetratricopeptide (TPR) repeat protein